MKRCKHENTIALAWSRDRKYCRRCFATIPLGPAAQASEAVAIEIRAAELVAALVGDRLASRSIDEIRGWVAAKHGLLGCPISTAEHAGYLARLIYEHKEEA